MFKKYTDVMYKGRYDHPIKITFLNGYSMTLTGEGGNSHLILGNKTGAIDLWVDTHCAPNNAYITSIDVVDEPGARLMKYIMSMLIKYSGNIWPSMFCFDFNFEKLDKFFAEIYQDMRDDRIRRF